MVSIKIIENKNNLFYDINSICENADSIYWTLVPNEVFAIYQSNLHYLFNNVTSPSLKDIVDWW